MQFGGLRDAVVPLHFLEIEQGQGQKRGRIIDQSAPDFDAQGRAFGRGEGDVAAPGLAPMGDFIHQHDKAGQAGADQ